MSERTHPAILLSRRLQDPPVDLQLFEEAHLAALREACASDPAIWDIYPISFAPAYFDTSMALIASKAGWVRFTAFAGGEVVGMTSYMTDANAPEIVDIGATFIVPRMRGTGYNGRMKRLMIRAAFAAGFAHVRFNVDMRNARSRRAVEKLGARLIEVREKDMPTWTGHVRDTAVYLLRRQQYESAWHLSSPA